MLRQRGEQLTAEANQCIGEEAAFIGATNVSTTIDNTLPPPDDDTQPLRHLDREARRRIPRLATCNLERTVTRKYISEQRP